MMDELVLEELAATFAERKTKRVWGCIELEIHDGQVVLLRKETKQKFNNGGSQHGPDRPRY